MKGVRQKVGDTLGKRLIPKCGARRIRTKKGWLGARFIRHYDKIRRN